MRPAENIKKSIKKLRFNTSAQGHQRLLGNILEALDRIEAQKSGAAAPEKRRIIMKTLFVKLTAAAAVVAVATLIVTRLSPVAGPSTAIAGIVEPFLTAHTATYKVTMTGTSVPKQEFDGMFMEPWRMRYTQPGGGTVIVDLEKGRMVTLLHQLKQAIVIEMTNVPEQPGSLNFFQEIRMRILKAKPFDDESVTYLGEEQIEGHTAIGYHVRKADLNATVWADRDTKMPLRMEVLDEPLNITMSNIKFNVPLDEKLFDTETPEGYSVKTIRRDMSEPDEQDLIESFRIWSEHMDGGFPSKMHRSAVNEFMQYQQQKTKEKGVEPSIDDVTRLQQLITDMTHGFPFVEALPAESDWHYAGKDVKYGQADKPIFWYRPKDSGTYRVIYGDLSVKDVAPEDLPK